MQVLLILMLMRLGFSKGINETIIPSKYCQYSIFCNAILLDYPNVTETYPKSKTEFEKLEKKSIGYLDDEHVKKEVILMFV